MFDPTAAADAHHAVTAPGGYEWWYFDAEDVANELRVVVIFFEGFVFHPGYLRRFAAFVRDPTRTPPPRPGEYPCSYFVLYHKDQIVAQVMQRHADISASTTGPRVRLGQNSLTPLPDGSLELDLTGVPWHLTGRGPQLSVGQTLSMKLRFTPTLKTEPLRRRFFARSWSAADHFWVLANPLCDVVGTVTVTGRAPVSLQARGYHDHNFGTGPIGPGLSRWMWGRVLLERHVMLFHVAEPKHGPVELHLLEADDHGCRELVPDPFKISWTRRTAALLAYPASVSIGPLQVSTPRVIDSSPFYLRLAYAASVRGQPATAFCEIAYPHRLRWPVLGRMIEMSIFDAK